MKSYHYAGHTSDMRLMVEAGDMPSLFEAALEGMNHVISEGFSDRDIEMTEQISISIESEDPAMMLVDFLSDVLSLTHLNKCIFCRIEFFLLTDKRMEGLLSGAKVAAFDRDVKAVTYHEAKITTNERGNYQTVIVFDI